jgi:hypothetical protein
MASETVVVVSDMAVPRVFSANEDIAQIVSVKVSVAGCIHLTSCI